MDDDPIVRIRTYNNHIAMRFNFMMEFLYFITNIYDIVNAEKSLCVIVLPCCGYMGWYGIAGSIYASLNRRTDFICVTCEINRNPLSEGQQKC